MDQRVAAFERVLNRCPVASVSYRELELLDLRTKHPLCFLGAPDEGSDSVSGFDQGPDGVGSSESGRPGHHHSQAVFGHFRGSFVAERACLVV